MFAKKQFAPGEILIVPSVQSDANLTTKSVSANAVETEVSAGSEDRFLITPSVCWEEGQEFLPLFWLVRREAPSKPANLVIKQIEVTQIVSLCTDSVAVCGVRKTAPETKETRVPIITNAAVIENGEELVVHSRTLPTKEKSSRSTDWKAAAKSKYRKSIEGK